MERSSYELLRIATKKKKQGDIESAIELLRKAYVQAEKEGKYLLIEEKLRLPMYLQEAGNATEAWEELNKIEKEIYWSDNLEKQTLACSELSIVYDKKRLFFQREKRYKRAVKMGVISYIFWALSRYLLYIYSGLDIDFRDFKEYTSDENMEKYMKKLLKKAKKEDALPELCRIVKKWI